MLASLFGRGGILALAILPYLSQAQSRISFPRIDGSGSERAVLVPVDDQGLYVTIGVVAADVTKGKVGEKSYELIAQDPQSRITLLRGPKSTEAPAEFGSGRTLKPGDKLLRSHNNSKAVVVSWESYFHEQLLPLSFMRVHHQGSIPSPGWALKGPDGKIVGICHQASDSFGHGTYALPSEAVQSVVASFKKHGKLRRSFCGINLDARDPVVSVIGIRPESPAAQSGIEKDDIILSIGGRPVQNYAEAIDAFFYLVPSDEIDFVVLRGVETKTLKVTPVIDPRYAASEKAGAKN